MQTWDDQNTVETVIYDAGNVSAYMCTYVHVCMFFISAAIFAHSDLPNSRKAMCLD